MVEVPASRASRYRTYLPWAVTLHLFVISSVLNPKPNQASLECALATSISSASTAALAAAALPNRSPPLVFHCAALCLRAPSVGLRPVAIQPASASSWWGIMGAGSDDRVAQQFLQV